MSSRLSCWVNSDRSGIHQRHHHHHYATKTTTTTAADVDQTGSDAVSRASFPRLDRRWKVTPPSGLAVISGLTDGRTEVFLRRRKRQRESEIRSFCLSRSLSLSRFLSLSFTASFPSRFHFFFFFFFDFSYDFFLEMMIYFSCLERSRLKNRNEC